MTTPLDIVDIHTHLWPPAWGPGGQYAKPASGFTPDVYRKITTPQALVDEFQAAGVSLAIVTATIESLFGAEGPVDPAAVREANNWLATISHYDQSLVGFAVTDAFSGEEGAREAEHAIGELGLSGLVIDSSRDGKFLADPSVRPTLEVATRYKVPVFVHPVAHPNSQVLIKGAGTLGNSLGRGLMNGIAFLSVIQSPLLDDLPDLHLIFATLGLGAIVQAARGGIYGRAERAAGNRPNIYFDTMGHDPAVIRTLTGFFGAERVLAGTDWPILAALDRKTLAASLAEAGLSEAEARLVAGGNARRLLGFREAQAQAAE
ncbi:2-amino-3-carboxymuconate-6-semialdehyde decarboxylase [Neorhizobium galegae bv. officinalis]|uniref:2-amino-3-carboxymuconate-6-semialdehyde decarboxylase n=1 Tax=Neorhizobium galegae bv. officinalis TaxID=323656 RepID=A0A0T7FD10_NEOGA|nr:amidohydrolase family protein [Neorhizobium galegae]CDZ32819.1 2-amino-3-carboxymuconate-6-semialdehyde decarboxylase [Neorhizobium galegae bv. officinalis]